MNLVATPCNSVQSEVSNLQVALCREMKRVKYVANLQLFNRISDIMTTKFDIRHVTVVLLRPHFVAFIKESGHRHVTIFRLCPRFVAFIKESGHRHVTIFRLCPHFIPFIKESGHRHVTIFRSCPHFVEFIKESGHRHVTIVRLCPHFEADIHTFRISVFRTTLRKMKSFAFPCF